MAGSTVGLSIYSAQHAVQPAEMDNCPARTTWGDPVVENLKVRLDATGHATYPMAAKLGLKAVDREMTVMIWYGSGKEKAVAASRASVFQTGSEVLLLPGRAAYPRAEA